MLFITKQVFARNFLGFSICSKEFYGEPQRFDSQGFFSFLFLLLFLKFCLCWVFTVACGLSSPSACGILASQPRMEPSSPVLAGQILNYWTTREVPTAKGFKSHLTT